MAHFFLNPWIYFVLKHKVNIRLVRLLKLAYSKGKRGQNIYKITKPLQYTKVTAINTSPKVKYFFIPITFNNDLIKASFSCKKFIVSIQTPTTQIENCNLKGYLQCNKILKVINL